MKAAIRLLIAGGMLAGVYLMPETAKADGFCGPGQHISACAIPSGPKKPGPVVSDIPLICCCTDIGDVCCVMGPGGPTVH